MLELFWSRKKERPKEQSPPEKPPILQRCADCGISEYPNPHLPPRLRPVDKVYIAGIAGIKESTNGMVTGIIGEIQ